MATPQNALMLAATAGAVEFLVEKTADSFPGHNHHGHNHALEQVGEQIAGAVFKAAGLNDVIASARESAKKAEFNLG